MRRTSIYTLGLCLLLLPVARARSAESSSAQPDRAPSSAAVENPEGRKIALYGTLEKKTSGRKGRQRTIYRLKQDSGLLVSLPKSPGIDLAQYLGREVVIVGPGRETVLSGPVPDSEGKGTRTVVLKKLTAITFVVPVEPEASARSSE